MTTVTTTTVTTPTSTAATPAVAARPKPAPGVTVDVVHAAESQIFSLEHTRESIAELCRALAPFTPAWRWIKDGFDGRGPIWRAIAVRVGMVTLVMRPNLIVPAACCACASVMRAEKTRADFERARSRGEVDRELESIMQMEMTARRVELTFGQEDATAVMEATATATERLASVTEWRSRTVSAAVMYAAAVMSVMSLFIPASTVMCWVLLYATRPMRLRVVPDPLTACWSRLPTKAREASKIQ